MNDINSFLEELKQYAQENKVPIVMDTSRRLLEVLVLSLQPERILEIGTAIGYSSILMAGLLGSRTSIDTIEVNPNMVEKAWENVRRAHMDENIRIIEGDAEEVLPVLSKEYDLIFLDAAKSKYIDFLPHCVRLVRENGLIITDNVLYKGMTKGPEHVKHKQRTAVTGLRNFLSELERHSQLKSVLLDIGDGVTVSVKTAKSNCNGDTK